MTARFRHAAHRVLVLALLVATPAAAQHPNNAPIPVPFGVGERLE